MNNPAEEIAPKNKSGLGAIFILIVFFACLAWLLSSPNRPSDAIQNQPHRGYVLTPRDYAWAEAKAKEHWTEDPTRSVLMEKPALYNVSAIPDVLKPIEQYPQKWKVVGHVRKDGTATDFEIILVRESDWSWDVVSVQTGDFGIGQIPPMRY